MKNHKIVVLALGLLILAGIIVVGLKGFNVDYMLKEHNSIEYKFEKDYNIDDVKSLVGEVFENKSYNVQEIEFFNDKVVISSETITTEEADSLITKLDSKYLKETKVDNEGNKEESENQENAENQEENTEVVTRKSDYTIKTEPKVRLNTLFRPYIKAILISAVIIVVYVAIRYKKLNSVKVLIELFSLIATTVLTMLSVLAIIRYPIDMIVIPAILMVVLVELVMFCYKKDDNK